MYQVTAIYADSEECGYGEGDSYEYAARECAESIPAMYPAELVNLTCTQGCVTVVTPLSLYLEATA